MSETFLGNCMLCHSSPIEVRHINLYTVGSEGTYACHKCEMKLVEFARSLSQENGKRKIQARLTKREPDKGEGSPLPALSNPQADTAKGALS
jgi:hypothetical protein